MTLGLTPRQAEALGFIRSFIAEKGYWPNYQEIGAAMGTRSKGAAHAIVQRLQERGAVRCSNKARSISIVEAA